jgi:nicotinate-nucleotide adenylyltransferase
VQRLATLAILTRDGETLPEGTALRAVAVPVTRVDVSATDVRRRAAEGRSIRYLVPEAVRAILERERPYGDRSR